MRSQRRGSDHSSPSSPSETLRGFAMFGASMAAPLATPTNEAPSIVATVVQGSPVLLVSVDSPRARGTARFTGDGTLVEAARS